MAAATASRALAKTPSALRRASAPLVWPSFTDLPQASKKPMVVAAGRSGSGDLETWRCAARDPHLDDGGAATRGAAPRESLQGR